jgi:hypothetical protein
LLENGVSGVSSTSPWTGAGGISGCASSSGTGSGFGVGGADIESSLDVRSFTDRESVDDAARILSFDDRFFGDEFAEDGGDSDEPEGDGVNCGDSAIVVDLRRDLW